MKIHPMIIYKTTKSVVQENNWWVLMNPGEIINNGRTFQRGISEYLNKYMQILKPQGECQMSKIPSDFLTALLSDISIHTLPMACQY